MYEAVHARPDGEATLARLAATAAEYGYQGVVVRNHGDATPVYDDVDRMRDTYGVDVVSGVEIRAKDPAQASGYLGSHRQRATVLLLHGGSTALNQFAVRQERIDVLAHPMRDGDLNHVLVRDATAHDVRLEVDLSTVLRASGGQRVRAVSGLRKLRELIEAYDAPFVVSADPASHLEMRTPEELIAVGESIGFDPEFIQSGLDEWERVASVNRERNAPDYVEPGVRTGRYVDGAGPERGPGSKEGDGGEASTDGAGGRR